MDLAASSRGQACLACQPCGLPCQACNQVGYCTAQQALRELVATLHFDRSCLPVGGTTAHQSDRRHLPLPESQGALGLHSGLQGLRYNLD